MIENRKRGRPRTLDANNRRRMIGVRLTKAARATLEALAEDSGRSLGGEAEYRLVKSFNDDEVLAELRLIRAMLDGGR